jgi:hypothetical protein
MMIINIETYQDALKKLSSPSTRGEGIDMLKKILDIKEAHLWRSEVIAPCCGNLGGFACQLNEETTLLEQAITLIEKGDMAAAAPVLERIGTLISYGMGQKETPELIARLTASPGKTPA